MFLGYSEKTTSSLEQSPYREANSGSAGQEITAIYGTWLFIAVFTRASQWSLS
jgi:hypothetical protein